VWSILRPPEYRLAVRQLKHRDENRREILTARRKARIYLNVSCVNASNSTFLTDYIDVKAVFQCGYQDKDLGVALKCDIPKINRTDPDAVSNLADDCGDSQVIDVISRDNLEPNCIIIVEIPQALEWKSLTSTSQLVRVFLTASLHRMPQWILLLANNPSSCAR